MVFEHKKINSLDDFFTVLSRRREKGVYFYRINGSSDDIGKFICEYYEAARKAGVIIEGKLANPTEANLSYYSEIMGMDFRMDVSFINESLKKWLPRMSDASRNLVASSVFDSLRLLQTQGKNENMLKNAYVKFMCWLYYKFERIVNLLGQESLPKILYQGAVGNYELMLISILSNAGCDVVLLQTGGDEAYLRLDPKSEKSLLYESENQEAFPADFSVTKFVSNPQRGQSKKRTVRCTNAWIKGEVFEDILTPTGLRGSDENLFYNCFCRVNGVSDRLTYANELYQFYISLENAKRNVVIVNGQIKRPDADEIMRIKRGNYARFEQLLAGLSVNIQYPQNPKLRELMALAFEEIMTEEAGRADANLNRLLNRGVTLLCLLRRYQDELFRTWKFPQVSCFIYLGGCRDANEALFLRLLSRLPCDVLILCPDRNKRCILQDKWLFEKNFSETLALSGFPVQRGGLHIATAAYHAERDLDEIMYSDRTIFREKQYTRANVISLTTMDREIPILWNADLKYRPNFSTVDGVVNIPVIYAQMSGVKNGKIGEYWALVRQLMTPETVVIDRPPFFSRESQNPVKMYASAFFKNGRLQRNAIKNHPAYQYGFLREEMQEHLLDKLEMMIEEKIIKGTFVNGMEYTVIAVALNLPRDVLRLIQKFDFTKANPKAIYINTTENLITLEDSIYLAYLNLIGFDVIFFIPTGYNIEGHFNKKLMEEHQLGDFIYDLSVPDWDSLPGKSLMSWVDKIFKKG